MPRRKRNRILTKMLPPGEVSTLIFYKYIEEELRERIYE
jgi:hypothetical protein